MHYHTAVIPKLIVAKGHKRSLCPKLLIGKKIGLEIKLPGQTPIIIHLTDVIKDKLQKRQDKRILILNKNRIAMLADSLLPITQDDIITIEIKGDKHYSLQEKYLKRWLDPILHNL
jgi:hypothetical protein